MKETIIEMHTKGYSQREIASKLNITRDKVRWVLKKSHPTLVNSYIPIGKTLLGCKNSSLETIPDKTNLKGRKSDTNWSIYSLVKRQDCYYDFYTGEILDEKYNEVMDIIYELVIKWLPFGRRVFTNLHSYCFSQNKDLDINHISNMISRFFICIQKGIVVNETVHNLDGYDYVLRKPIQNSLFNLRRV